MATVFLTTVSRPNPNNNNWDLSAYERIQRSAASSTDKKHILTDNPELADIILFAELGTQTGPFDEYIRYHPLFKKYRHKVYVFMNNDSPIHLIQGIYTSLEKRFYFPSKVHAGFYLSNSENPLLDFIPWNNKAPYLYSFVGSVNNHPVRKIVSQIKDTLFYFKNTSNQYIEAASTGNQTQLQQLYSQFINILKNSKFILCPRGVGTSSIRLFEAMRAGRVPVILSDQWVEPYGPDWKSFSLQIPEKDIMKIPSLLRSLEKEAPQMAANARAAWEQFFSPNNLFNTIIEWCLDIQSKQKLPEPLFYYLGFLQLFRPKYAKRYLKTRWALFKSNKKLYI